MGALRKRTKAGVLAAAVVALGITAAACGPAPASNCPGAPPDVITSTIYNRVNGDRAAWGLRGLGWDPQLRCLAQEWSESMAIRKQLVHRDLGAVITSPGYESYMGLAENIFVGPASVSGDTIHNAWMNSAGHRANILGNFDSIGIGWATTDDGRLYATENFGRH
jgi:uncharacterized protein YkwD